jgi:hypothetical protein
MSEFLNSAGTTRRRGLFFLWSAVTLAFAGAAAVLTASQSQAQTSGMERRGDRRTGRDVRRTDRRTGRTTRREERRN